MASKLNPYVSFDGNARQALEFYRDVLRLRRETPGLYAAGLAWRESAPDVLDFDRDDALRCVVNLSTEPVDVPAGRVLLSSIPLEDGQLPPDATAWLRP